MNETIVSLTKLWYALVNMDHHKDRDCHFYVSTSYSYGEDPVYTAYHYGYVYKEISLEFSSYVEAESALMIELCKAIKEYVYSIADDFRLSDILKEHEQAWKLAKSVDHSVD